MKTEGDAKIVPRWEWRTSIYYGSVARKMQKFEMVFLTSNVCIESMSVVLNCGNRCLRPNSR